MRFSSNNKQDNYTMRSISSQGKKQPKAKSFELRNIFLQLSDDPRGQIGGQNALLAKGFIAEEAAGHALHKMTHIQIGNNVNENIIR